MEGGRGREKEKWRDLKRMGRDREEEWGDKSRRLEGGMGRIEKWGDGESCDIGKERDDEVEIELEKC